MGKNHFAFAAALVVSLSSAAFAQDTELTEVVEADEATVELRKLAIAQGIVKVGFPEEIREEMFFGPMDQMMLQMVEASPAIANLEDEGLLKILGNWMSENSGEMKNTLRGHIPRIMDAMAQAYANIFTEQELTDILNFASTPSGQRFLGQSSKVISDPDFATANQAFINESMEQLRSSQEGLKDDIVKYLEQKTENTSDSIDS